MNHVAGRLAAGTHELGGETQVSIQADPAGSGPEASRQATAAQASGNGSSAEHGVSFKTVDLTLSFGTRAVLSNIATDFQRSRITALLGPTGSGKSTLLRTFNRMNDKVTGYRHDGDVMLEGNSIFGSGVELMSLRRRVGMVFQRPGTGCPAALTVAVLRSDLFRIAVETPEGTGRSFTGAWTHALQDWDS
jgi:ABC-type multidrug transport system fused ATPase/permease subunit